MQETTEKKKCFPLDENLPPAHAIHPGSILQDELEFRGIKQIEFSEKTGIDKTTISKILKGIRPITALHALAFERVLCIDAELWLTLQAKYELDVLRLERKAEAA